MVNKTIYLTLISLILTSLAPCKACEPDGEIGWFSMMSVCATDIPESIMSGVKETIEYGDLILVGVEMMVIPQIIGMVLTNADQALHDCQFVVHKCKEGGELYFQPKYPDTSVFVKPTFDNKEVAETLIESVDTTTMTKFINGLLKFKTRYAYTKTATKATKWILKQFKDVVSSRDDIEIETVKEPKTKQKSILVTIKGSSGDDENIILGAHLDSTADRDAGEMTEDKPAPGLDDDGSGVMVLLEILRVVVETGFKPQKNVQIMAYAAEEVGLLGSDQIAKDYKSKGMKVIGMLEFDGVGNNGNMIPNSLGFTKDFSNPDHADYLGHLTKEFLGLPYFYYTCGHECSDHASWHQQGYPSTVASENEGNPGYHTKNDNVVDVEYAANFAKLGVAYLAELAKGTF